MRCPKSWPLGNIFAKIAAAHILLSFSVVIKSPRCPDVPEDNPTAISPLSSVKFRVFSLSIAKAKASSRSTPWVLSSLKCVIMNALSI